jgi:hypothetical protein
VYQRLQFLLLPSKALVGIAAALVATVAVALAPESSDPVSFRYPPGGLIKAC